MTRCTYVGGEAKTLFVEPGKQVVPVGLVGMNVRTDAAADGEDIRLSIRPAGGIHYSVGSTWTVVERSRTLKATVSGRIGDLPLDAPNTTLTFADLEHHKAYRWAGGSATTGQSARAAKRGWTNDYDDRSGGACWVRMGKLAGRPGNAHSGVGPRRDLAHCRPSRLFVGRRLRRMGRLAVPAGHHPAGLRASLLGMHVAPRGAGNTPWRPDLDPRRLRRVHHLRPDCDDRMVRGITQALFRRTEFRQSTCGGSQSLHRRPGARLEAGVCRVHRLHGHRTARCDRPGRSAHHRHRRGHHLLPTLESLTATRQAGRGTPCHTAKESPCHTVLLHPPPSSWQQQSPPARPHRLRPQQPPTPRRPPSPACPSAGSLTPAIRGHRLPPGLDGDRDHAGPLGQPPPRLGQS